MVQAALPLFLVFFLYATRVVFASNVIPEVTNDNAYARAYFWIKKTDGATDIIMIPPRSKKAVPENTVELQFLYLEGKGSESVLPELSTLHLTAPPFSIDEEELAPVLMETSSASKRFFSRQEEAHALEMRYAEELEARRMPVTKNRPPESGSRLKRFFEEHW
ncbi:MAG TPA: hypothetical protein VD913_06555 [bacterium]|nr:hypothetical protein [bacterium]